MADPTGIYDGSAERYVSIASLADKINGLFCVFRTHVGGKKCGNYATHWAAYKSRILQMCSDHGRLGDDSVCATIWGDDSMFISKKHDIGDMLRYTCGVCGSMVPSADIAPDNDNDINCTCKACAVKEAVS